MIQMDKPTGPGIPKHNGVVGRPPTLTWDRTDLVVLFAI
jgi:hypothetical protein